MKTEWIKIERLETAIKVRNTKIEALRNKHIISKGVRVYENGCIGISGCIGDTSDEALLEQAKENLSVQIEYPFALEGPKKDHRNYIKNALTKEAIFDYTNEVLKRLREDYPHFDFSETAKIKEIHYTMQNSEGLDLAYHDATYELGLILKEKKSANLFDGFLMSMGRELDLEQFWAANKPLLEAYATPVALPDMEKMPIIFLGYTAFSGFLNRCLNGESYATGSSLFSGKMNQQLFNSRVNIVQSSNAKKTLMPFFDSEGVVSPHDEWPLVSDGVLKNVFTDKKMADRYKLPHTGAASGAYDGMPTLASVPIEIKTDTHDLKKVLGGRPAVVVMISSGGDFTPDGDYAAPVQVSFLYDGDNLVGKLPEFSVRSNLFRALGEDYMGTFDNSYFYMGDFDTQIMVTEMAIVK